MYSDTSKVTFLPRAPISTVQSVGGVPVSEMDSSSGGGFISGLITLFFIAVLISTGSLFAYQKYLESQQNAIVSELQKKQESINPKLIANIVALNTQINYAKKLLGKHVVLSPFFEELHQKTLKDIQFDSFEYKESVDQQAVTTGPDKNPSNYQVVLYGKSRSYESIAQQSDIFADESGSLLRTHFFSNFKLETEKSLISFVLTVDLPANKIIPAITVGKKQNIQIKPISAEGSSDAKSLDIPKNTETIDPFGENDDTIFDLSSTNTDSFDVPPTVDKKPTKTITDKKS